jgi:uncharacterized membrane protein
MHAQVRHARFTLVVVGVASVLTVAGCLVALNYLGPRGAWSGFGFLGLTGLLGFGGLFYRKRRGEKGVVMDERDTQIGNRSSLGAALLVAFGFWGVVCMGAWFWVVLRYGFDASETTGIPVFWLPLLYMVSGLVFQAVWSASILVHYRFEGKEDES